MDTGRSVAAPYKDEVTVLLRPCEFGAGTPAYNGAMYPWLLVAHAWVRWVVVLAGLVLVARMARGGSAWTTGDARLSQAFVGALDLQMTLGLLLYVGFSPLTRAAFAHIGAAMHDDVLRFWAVEHVTGMVAAIAIAHVGHARVRRLPLPVRRRAAWRWFGAALVVVLITIPWPVMPYGRPLLRW